MSTMYPLGAPGKHPRNGLEVGDRVRYTRKFLRDTGQYTGPAGISKGTIVRFEPLGKGTMLAVVSWAEWNDPEMTWPIRVDNLEITR